MSIYNRISPVPQKFGYLEGKEILLGVSGSPNYTIEANVPEKCELSANAVKKLTEKLAARLAVCPCSAKGEVKITLQLADAPEGMKNADQGYAIKAADNAITLTGYGAAGLYYAVTTLLQCLKVEEGKLSLPAFEMEDYPDLKTRGHFMETRYGSNLMELEDWKHVVDHMEEMKQNHLAVSVYGCWCVQYDGQVSEYLYVPVKKYPKLKAPVYGKYYSPKKGEWVNFKRLPPMVEKDYFAELIAYGKTRGVEVCPMFNSFGHNTLIPAQYPEVSAKDENGEPTLTGFCTANPKTYEMMFDIYDEIIDRYLKPNGITSFDVGLDEVGDGIAQNANDIFKNRSPWCKCPECAGKDRGQIYINHAIKLLKHLKSRGMKNIYMYSDMLIEKDCGQDMESYKLGDNTLNMYNALKENDLLDVVSIDWWTYSDYREDFMFKTTRPELGIRHTVKPWNGYYHWTILSNPLKNIYHHGAVAHEENAEGMRSYSAWDESFDRNHRAQADYAWNFVGAGSIEDEKVRYVRLNFPKQYDAAKRALDLIDLCTYTTNGEGVNRNALLQHEMSYYFYSYVRADKPYPRHFPGEAVQAVVYDAEKMEHVKQIASMAKESSAIFDTLSKDSSGNIAMAKRFKYETANYATLADDYIALAEMDRLAKEFMETKCCCAKKKIQALAKARKEARLALMILFEETKEEFLMASHMRNHTIFMQYFADLEAYLARTPCEDVVLDFTDNTHFASEAFWALR